MEKLKLISINIEMARRLDSVQKFFEQERPDVICLQEVFEQNLQSFAGMLRMQFAFAQMNLSGRENQMDPPFFPLGIGMLSELPMQDIRVAYYLRDEEFAKEHVFSGNSQDDAHLFMYANIQKANTTFPIGTTHFIWTPDGHADEVQRRALLALLHILQGIPEIVFCGDMNAPRGREIFDAIAKEYRDNIPQQYTTSIDINLHRLADKLRGEPLMVDGLFSTGQYQCSNVRLQAGVSDHMAIVAEISFAEKLRKRVSRATTEDSNT